MRGLCFVLMLLAGVLTGCKKEEPKGVNVTAPGVNIQTGPGGVNVKAPGVDVNTGNTGVGVNAPGVNVKVAPK